MTTSPTWVPGAAGSLYDVDNLPYGVFAPPGEPPRTGVRIGDHVLDLADAARRTRREYVTQFDAPALNPFLAAGPAAWSSARSWIVTLLLDRSFADRLTLHPLTGVTLQLPFEVADYVDFYASIDHATNVGRILRPDGDALMPNWKHLPVGYHGRAGSIVVSGTDIHRPSGQRKVAGCDRPVYGPCERLDIEAELGFVVGRSVPLGTRVPTEAFPDTVFGVTGVNDWSARDIQAWEYVPLGPNLGKSFATSISAWVTPLAALEPALINLPAQEPAVLPYLEAARRTGYDIDVEVEVNGTVVARPTYSSMYWSPAQMLAHMTVNGASLRVGDFFASGTISGPAKDQRGSFIELSRGGAEPWIAGGEERTYLQDGDEVVLRFSAPAAAGRTNQRIGLGEVRATVLPTT